MSRIWTGRKGQMNYLVEKHFGKVLGMRFQVMMDNDIFIKSEDESIWSRIRNDKESLHVYFDLVEILDIPSSVPQSYYEVFLLRGFKDAIKAELISIDVKTEMTDIQSVKRAKKNKEAKRKKSFEDSYRFARDNNFSVGSMLAKLPNGEEIKKLVIN